MWNYSRVFTPLHGRAALLYSACCSHHGIVKQLQWQEIREIRENSTVSLCCHSCCVQELLETISKIHQPCKLSNFLLSEESPLFQEQFEAYCAQHSWNQRQTQSKAPSTLLLAVVFRCLVSTPVLSSHSQFAHENHNAEWMLNKWMVIVLYGVSWYDSLIDIGSECVQ